MVIYRDFFQPLAEFHKFKSFSLTFSFNVVCSVVFLQYPDLHNSYVNCFINSFNCKLDAASVLMECCPESCIWKIKDICINGTWNTLLIHGFSLVNAWLLMASDTAFYAITLITNFYPIFFIIFIRSTRLSFSLNCELFIPQIVCLQ